MHASRVLAAALLLVLPLAACGKGGDDATTKTRTVDCSDAALPEADRIEYCDAAGAQAGASPSEITPVKLGTPVTTAGTRFQNGGGSLEVTPTSVLYLAEIQGVKAENAVFAVVTVKDRPTGRAAGESAPVEGGGWEWVAPDGEAIEAGNGAAGELAPIDGFDGEGVIQGGTFAWSSQVFDLAEAQRAGTLDYVDGKGATHRWQMPAKDLGPQVAELKEKLAG